ncbi:hypothetical protein ACHAXR_005545 [Thalassiosira sp. AJA248-18]
MNDQQETTANTPSDPKLCRLGCGFFFSNRFSPPIPPPLSSLQGSNATGDCCSRCWNEMRKKDGAAAAAAPAPAVAQPSATPAPTPAATTSPTPAPVAEPTPTVAETKAPAAAPSPAKKNKKKKKVNYRNMIAGMMEGGARDAEKEKESIEKVTGGGAFLKIDKI